MNEEKEADEKLTQIAEKVNAAAETAEESEEAIQPAREGQRKSKARKVA